jgi:hypothetical protein
MIWTSGWITTIIREPIKVRCAVGEHRWQTLLDGKQIWAQKNLNQI